MVQRRVKTGCGRQVNGTSPVRVAVDQEFGRQVVAVAGPVVEQDGDTVLDTAVADRAARAAQGTGAARVVLQGKSHSVGDVPATPRANVQDERSVKRSDGRHLLLLPE